MFLSIRQIPKFSESMKNKTYFSCFSLNSSQKSADLMAKVTSPSSVTQPTSPKPPSWPMLFLSSLVFLCARRVLARRMFRLKFLIFQRENHNIRTFL